MIVFTRDLARRFRAVARKCVREWRKRPPPVVGAVVRDGSLTLSADLGDVVVSVTASVRGRADAALAFPLPVLDAAQGTTDAPVEVAVAGGGGTASWADRGGGRSYPFAPLPVPPLPRDPRLAVVPAAFLAALHECGRSAGADTARFALHAVRVRGSAGTVTGTDAKQALVWGGFTFPFAADVLVPAVPAFGTRELAGAGGVCLGLTDTHLVVAAGAWVVRLARVPGRHPDVEGVVPRHPPTVIRVGDAGAAAVLATLPRLPGGDAAGRPVTLDAAAGLVVRAAGGGDVREVAAPETTVEGTPARVAVDRAYLARALALGCRTIRLAGPCKPVVAEGGDRLYVFAALAPDEVVPPGLDAETLTPGQAVATTPTARAELEPSPEPEPRRRSAMRPRPTNTPAPAGVVTDPSPAEPIDPVAEAEGLRAALAEALTRGGRLVAALKHARRERKALSAVWSSLRGLNLGNGGRS